MENIKPNNSHLKEIKTAEPLTNFPTSKLSDIRYDKIWSLSDIRFGFITELTFVSLAGGFVFGKDNIKIAFEDVKEFYSQKLSPLSQQLTKKLDRGLTKVVQGSNFKVQSMQARNTIDYTNTNTTTAVASVLSSFKAQGNVTTTSYIYSITFRRK